MKNLKPLVSIITPVYNGEKFITQCIESVLNQEYTNWELIIIDDHSIDSTINLIEEYCLKDKRIKIIKNNKNKGVAYSRNQGLISAKGEFIAFLDSDDLWKEEKLEKQIDFMVKNNYKFTFCDYDVIDEEGIFLRKVTCNYDKVDYKVMLRKNYIGCLTVIIRSDILKKYSIPQVRHEDYALWLDILENDVNNAVNLKENLAYYRISKNSLSANKLKSAIWTWNIYRNYKKIPFVQACFYFMSYVIKSIIKIRE